MGDDASLRRRGHPWWVHIRTRRVRLPWVFQKVPTTLLQYPLHFCSLSLVFRQKSGVFLDFSHVFPDWLGDDASQRRKGYFLWVQSRRKDASSPSRDKLLTKNTVACARFAHIRARKCHAHHVFVYNLYTLFGKDRPLHYLCTNVKT